MAADLLLVTLIVTCVIVMNADVSDVLKATCVSEELLKSAETGLRVELK